MPTGEFGRRARPGRKGAAAAQNSLRLNFTTAPIRGCALIVLADALATWIERARSRRALGGLDERMQGDIGIDRGAIQAESGKPFWRR